MFELLGLPEEALVQYDELDALFTQFVLNSAHGGWLAFGLEPFQAGLEPFQTGLEPS